jgi:hypothetical protein
VTREVKILAGKDKGKHSVEKVLYICSKEMDPERAEWLLGIIREYWSIEGCLHQRLDVSAGEDSSRVRNRNSLLVLGILRRSVMGIYEQWRRKRKNKRQSTFKDFYDSMNAFNHRQAFTKLSSSK